MKSNSLVKIQVMIHPYSKEVPHDGTISNGRIMMKKTKGYTWKQSTKEKTIYIYIDIHQVTESATIEENLR